MSIMSSLFLLMSRHVTVSLYGTAYIILAIPLVCYTLVTEVRFVTSLSKSHTQHWFISSQRFGSVALNRRIGFQMSTHIYPYDEVIKMTKRLD